MAREQAFGGNQLTQDIARLFGMTFEEAEAEKRRNNLPRNYEVRTAAPFVEALALEVSRALQFFFTSTQFNQVRPHRSRGWVCRASRWSMRWLLRGRKSIRSLPTRLPTCFFRSESRPKISCRMRFVAGGRLWPCLAEVRRMIRINLLPHREEKRKARRQQFYGLLVLVSVLAGLIVFLTYSIIDGYISSQEASERFPEVGDRRTRQGNRRDQDGSRSRHRRCSRTQANHRIPAARPG
jgi:hypothetical protein